MKIRATLSIVKSLQPLQVKGADGYGQAWSTNCLGRQVRSGTATSENGDLDSRCILYLGSIRSRTNLRRDIPCRRDHLLVCISSRNNNPALDPAMSAPQYIAVILCETCIYELICKYSAFAYLYGDTMSISTVIGREFHIYSVG